MSRVLRMSKAELRAALGPALNPAIDLAKVGPDSPLHQLRPQRKHGEEEHKGQAFFFAHYRDTLPSAHRHLIFGVPNFSGRLGRLTAKIGKRLNDEGRLPGVWDIHWPLPTTRYHGLWIECKIRPNHLTPAQRDFGARLNTLGYCMLVVRAVDAPMLAQSIHRATYAYGQIDTVGRDAVVSACATFSELTRYTDGET